MDGLRQRNIARGFVAVGSAKVTKMGCYHSQCTREADQDDRLEFFQHFTTGLEFRWGGRHERTQLAATAFTGFA